MRQSPHVLAIVAALHLGAGGAAGAQIYPTDADTTLVRVMASAEAYVRPTRAVVSLQISTSRTSPEAAALANSEARSRTLEALHRLGFDDEDITLWGYGSAPASPERFGPPPAAGTTDYDVKSGLRVVVTDLERLDPLVSSALLAGATVTTVSFESDRTQDALRTAAETAVARARAQGEAMAAAAGGRLGALMAIATNPDYSGVAAQQQRWSVYSGNPGSPGVVLFPRDGVVSVSVQVQWVFEPG